MNIVHIGILQDKREIDGAWMPVGPSGRVFEHLGARTKIDAWKLLLARVGDPGCNTVDKLRARGYNVEFVIAT